MLGGTQRKVLVLGATGRLGRLVCEELCRTRGPGSVIVGSRTADRGRDYARGLGEEASARSVDVTDTSSVADAIDPRLAAVIVAVPQTQPIVQATCIQHSVPCLDVTVGADLIEQVKQLDSQAKEHRVASIVTAGLFPGMSAIMANHAVESVDNPTSIDVGLLQSSNASAGATGIADMLGVFARPVRLNKQEASQSSRGFTQKRDMVFPVPFGRREVRLIDWPEASVVAQWCGVHDVNYWTGYDSTSLQRLISGLNEGAPAAAVQHRSNTTSLCQAHTVHQTQQGSVVGDDRPHRRSEGTHRRFAGHPPAEFARSL